MILALGEKTSRLGFLWYLAVPSGEGFVHKPSMAHPAKIFNTARRKLAFLPGKSNAHFI